MKRVYRLPDLRKVGIDYSDVHLRRLEEDGSFPRRFKLNPNGGPQGAIGWDAGEIDRHLDSLIAARDKGRFAPVEDVVLEEDERQRTAVTAE